MKENKIETWWKTGWDEFAVEAVEVVREGKSTVTTREKHWSFGGSEGEFVETRHAKRSRYECFFKTAREMEAHLNEKMKNERAQFEQLKQAHARSMAKLRKAHP